MNANFTPAIAANIHALADVLRQAYERAEEALYDLHSSGCLLISQALTDDLAARNIGAGVDRAEQDYLQHLAAAGYLQVTVRAKRSPR